MYGEITKNSSMKSHMPNTKLHANTTSIIISPQCAQKTEFDDSTDFNEVRTVGKKSQFPRKCCWNLVKGPGRLAHSRPDPPKFKETSNLMWFSLIRVYFIFVCLLRLILYDSKPQNQMWDWNQKCFHFILQKSLIKLSTWLTDLTLRFLYIIGCSGPRCGRPAQRFVFRAGQAARAAGRLTGVSASADFCALPRIHEAWKGCEDDFRLCTLLAKNELEAVTVLPTIFFLSRYHDRSEQKPK